MTHQHERRGADQHEARGDALDDAIRGGGGPPRATRGGIQQTCHLLVDACVAHLSLRVFSSPVRWTFLQFTNPPRVTAVPCRLSARRAEFSRRQSSRPLLVVLSALREREAREAAPGAGADAAPLSFGVRAREMSRFPRTASTLVETAVALRSGATSASDLLTAATRRMGATRHLNAFIGGVLPRAIERAEASDERRRSRARSASRASSSSSSFPRVEKETRRDDTFGATTECAHVPSLLDGVPIAVKDNFFVPGAPTTAGSNALRDFVAPDVPGAFESTVTRRLASRGAVLFAKTNMDEFGMGSANAHSAFGAAVNPWTRKYVTDETDETVSKKQTMRVPGGSSGGSAVAVASGVAVAAVGSDTGGSARLPASYCGVVGFKPTYGRVSRWGLVPYCSSLDCPGFLTRTVADAVLMLDATQGRDALDPATLDADERVAALARDVEANVARRVEASKTEAHTKARTSEARTEDDTVSVVRDRGYLRSKPGFPLAGWRVGIPNEYFVAELSDETARAWTETADACERAGASVVPVSLPHTRAALAAYYVIAPAEASSNLARYDGVRFGYRPQEKEKEKEDTYGLSEDLSSTSPFASAAASFRGAAFGAETRRRVLVGTFVSGSARVARYVEKAQKVRRAVSDDFRDVFAKVDILLVPTAPATAPPLFDENAENAENADASLAAYAADAMTVPASLAGLPAVSLPVGLGTETGLPVGVQVIAARGNDADALGFAMRLEARVEALGDRGGGAGPEAAADGKAGAVGWGERHRAVGVLEATRFAIGG